jgi:hypothetical protein
MNKINITILLTLAVVGVLLFRNYGVKAVGETISPDNQKTFEEKELFKAAKNVGEINEGQLITTSFGQYEYKDGSWKKINEIWNVAGVGNLKK